MNLKEYFRQRLDEAIRADKTSRQKQSRIRKVRGVDSKRENRVTPDDHPVLDIADPRNRAMLRAGFSDASTKAYARAMDSAINAEFGIPK